MQPRTMHHLRQLSTGSSYYPEPRFPPPGSRTAKVFNGVHKTMVFGLLGLTVYLGSYVVAAVGSKMQSKKNRQELKEQREI